MPNDDIGSAVLYGGSGGTDATTASIVSQGSTARCGGRAADPWPAWAAAQLHRAVDLAAGAGDQLGIARLLYREWFNPAVDAAPPALSRPLVGAFRAAHAGSGVRIRRDGLQTVDRYDLLGPDGWWRTWGTAWTPPRSRPGSVRLMLTPRAERLGDLVATVTGALLRSPVAWSLGCATRPRRIARYGSAVLDVPSLDALPDGLLDAVVPLLHPVAPPLCLPVAPGVGLSEYPDNGMTFGEHRCHLIALALRHPSSDKHPLRSIAAVFAAHGIAPERPHAAA